MTYRSTLGVWGGFLWLSLATACGDSNESAVGQRSTDTGGSSGAAGAAGGGAAGTSGKSGAAGAGAGEGGSSGASGQAGAAGSPAVKCGLLVKVGEAVTVESGGGQYFQRPRLSEVDGATVALGVGIAPVESPVVTTVPISYATMQPWGAWPIAAPALMQTTFGGGTAFELGGGQGNLWLASVTGAELDQPGMTVLRLTGSAPPGDLVPIDQVSKRPLFLTATGDSLLVGGDSGGFVRGARVVGETSEPLVGSLGCADSGPLWSDAVRLPDGSDLFMVTTGAVAPSCEDDGPKGPPTHVVLYRRKGAGVELMFDMDLKVTVTYARMVPRNSGAWLLVQGGDGEVPGPLQAMNVDSGGHVTAQLITVLPEGVLYTEPGVARMGDRFAVVWADQLGQVDKLMVQVFDSNGSSLPVKIGNFSGTRRAIGSPDGQSLLVGWDNDSGPQPNTLNLVRLDCASDAQ